MLSRLSIVAAIAATFVFTASASAEHIRSHSNKNGHVNRNVTVHRHVDVHRHIDVHRHGDGHRSHRLVIGRPYHGGVWYGTGRRHWRGQWYAYGVGPCWFLTPFNYYVWTCS